MNDRGLKLLPDLAKPHDQTQSNDQPRLLHQQQPATASPPLTLDANGLGTAENAQAASSVQGGAVAVLPPSADTSSQGKQADGERKIKTVSATFRVPHAEIPIQGPTANNPVGVYAASFWVGIDGVTISPSPSSSSVDGGGSEDGCDPSTSSLRLGIDIFYDGTLGGEQPPFAWYQYLPGSAVGFGQNFSVISGDLVRLTAISLPSSGQGVDGGGGSVTIENFGNDAAAAQNKKALQTATHTFSVADGPALCQTQASFIVEDFPLAGLPDFPVALTNFTSVTFADLDVRDTQGENIPMDLVPKMERRKRANARMRAGAQDHAQVRTLDIYQERQGGRLTDCGVVTGQGDSTNVVCERIVQA